MNQLADILSNYFNIHKEIVFSDEIKYEDIKIFPAYEISILFLNSETISSFSIKPICLIINKFKDNKEEFYLHFLDSSIIDDYNSNKSINKIVREFVMEKIIN
ncbi:hypothetical protein MBCUT_08410 [Methanobrevibacter cuticularis]|uniref:Uncharacterized protein n=1 Tax=Methanobrevibacter cuticularis TaxID=47311 RepID=A0A166EAP4_9EURY|nr:hypothetical protein [Methanobrevibacter cuticularis]KZX16455.1 hypothetical protein MBCUT_08410 [Methanobrevibacter cuticularis]